MENDESEARGARSPVKAAFVERFIQFNVWNKDIYRRREESRALKKKKQWRVNKMYSEAKTGHNDWKYVCSSDARCCRLTLKGILEWNSEPAN